MSGDGWYAPVVARQVLDDRAVAAVLVATLNVVLGAGAAWRLAAPGDGYRSVAAGSPDGAVPVWGSARSLGPERAVLLNAALGHHFAYDDSVDVLLGHPSVVLVPPLLALAEESPLPLESYLSAYASGYESMVRLARRLNPDHYRRGFHATATLGTLGAANAVAVAGGAGERERTAAVGIAASRAGGLRAAIGHPCRAWHAGFAATQGMEAALLARDGVRTSPSAITGRSGFLTTFGSPERTGAGSHPEQPIDEPALNGPAVLNLKEYPGCGALAPALSALREARQRLGARTGDVAGVRVRVNPFVLEVVGTGWPAAAAGAGFSLSFALAVGLRHGRLQPHHLVDQLVGDAGLRALADRVAVTVDDVGPTKYASSVRVRTRQGRTATVTRPGVGGQPASRYSVTDVVRRWADQPPSGLAAAAGDFVRAGPAGMRQRLHGLLQELGGPS